MARWEAPQLTRGIVDNKSRTQSQINFLSESRNTPTSGMIRKRRLAPMPIAALAVCCLKPFMVQNKGTRGCGDCRIIKSPDEERCQMNVEKFEDRKLKFETSAKIESDLH